MAAEPLFEVKALESDLAQCAEQLAQLRGQVAAEHAILRMWLGVIPEAAGWPSEVFMHETWTLLMRQIKVITDAS